MPPAIPILLYHSVTDEPASEIAAYTLTPSAFERHLSLIADAGCETLTVSGLLDGLVDPETLPARPVLITFDDGYSDNLSKAVPALERRNMAATFYLPTRYLGGAISPVTGRGPRLSSRDACTLDGAGFEVGAHSHSHIELDVATLATARQEINLSKDILEHTLGHHVRSFAYPHGFSTPAVQREVRSAGFDSACGVRNALSHPNDDRWQLARLTVKPETTEDLFAAWLRGAGANLAKAGTSPATTIYRMVRQARSWLPA